MPAADKPVLRIVSLGGSGDIGKNMLAFEYDDTIVVVDAGVMFPGEEQPGVDLILPDFTWLLANRNRVAAICLTHGHEDHIGALPFVLRQLQVPVYGTRLTLGMVREKLTEHGLQAATQLIEYQPGTPIAFGPLSVEAVHVTHSLPDAVSLIIGSPVGVVVHTSDFKLDQSPVDGRLTDISRLAQVGDAGVRLLISDSVNVERPGWCPSESSLVPVFDRFVRESTGRVIVAMFGSSLHRVQTLFDVSARYGRKVALFGRSMIQNVDIARSLGHVRYDDGQRIKIDDVGGYHPAEIVVLTTGSQGEPLAGLTRMSRDDEARITLQPSDTVILSSTPIPGNEDMVWRVVNRIFRKGARVVYHSLQNVHVSGHAYQEELKMMMNLVRAECVAPYHGEPRHYHAYGELAREMGYADDSILTFETGQVLEIDDDGVRRVESDIPHGSILVDGISTGGVSEMVVRDRRHLAQDGTVIATLIMDRATGEIIAGPDLHARGFLKPEDTDTLFQELAPHIADAVAELANDAESDLDTVRATVSQSATRFLRKRTNRRPVIVPVVLEV